MRERGMADGEGAGAAGELGVVLEVCVECLESVEAAFRGGARRVEVCASLVEGGTTPSLGLVHASVRASARFEGRVHVLIRPRAGDFCYAEEEVRLCEEEIELAKRAGAHGVVVGALRPDGAVDEKALERWCAAAAPMSVTFHRAIDVARDWREALSALSRHRVDRVLTSGGCASCAEPAALERIAQMRAAAGDRLCVCVGGGVQASNVAAIVLATGAREIHASGASRRPGEGGDL